MTVAIFRADLSQINAPNVEMVQAEFNSRINQLGLANSVLYSPE
ncbi:MAG: hypothetical protein MRECE_11c028 [Mycoplasmataceae bacterium CE_OT135]|nr:MAG: hypothetical protein MRECE_11c028 [Mycoplasmataceae bacterium CE_OT135]